MRVQSCFPLDALDGHDILSLEKSPRHDFTFQVPAPSYPRIDLGRIPISKFKNLENFLVVLKEWTKVSFVQFVTQYTR